MLTRRHPVLAGLVLCALGAARVIVACDLNPQPLPPGDTSGGDSGFANTPTSGAGQDAGTGAIGPSSDGGAESDVGATPAPPADAALTDSGNRVGDGAAEGATDAAEDAPSDGQADAPADATDEGG